MASLRSEFVVDDECLKVIGAVNSFKYFISIVEECECQQLVAWPFMS